MRRCLLACCLLGPASSDVGREIPHRTCHPVGLFLCYSSRQCQACGSGFAAACAGRDGRGRGPAQGGRPALPKARPALHGGRAGAGDAVYFPAHRPARTRPARWPGCGPLRGGPEMPPTGAARSSLPLDAVTLERAIAHNECYTSAESPAPDTAYNTRYVPRRHCRALPAMRRGAQ